MSDNDEKMKFDKENIKVDKKISENEKVKMRAHN